MRKPLLPLRCPLRTPPRSLCPRSPLRPRAASPGPFAAVAAPLENV